MGDRDYRSLIRSALDSIGRESDIKVDASDYDTIHLHEAVRCLRRAYYDRIDPIADSVRGFNDLSAGLLRRLHYGAEAKDFEVGSAMLQARPDMIVDDSIILFRAASSPPENPASSDMLYLNACLWIYGKQDGMIVYITGDRQESAFSLSKNKAMFEETARRVRVLRDLLKEASVPILEPSPECTSCQYYQRCYAKERIGRSVSIAEMVGFKK